MEKVSLDQHISRQFNADLEHLKSQTLAMGGMVEKQLHDAMMALENADSELAMQVLEAEKKIDEMELIIDDACTTTIARRQPAATDLRMILAVSRSVRDPERIGDEIFLSSYGRATGFCIDPIEKKPLYHFYPGSSVLSFGTAGCNLGCKFCQKDRKSVV